MADRAFNDLIDIMRDTRVGLRDRVNAAVSASRIAPLGLGGDAEPPEVIVFLRSIVDYNHNGVQLSPSLRRDASAAAGFWERRARKAAITYDVGDPEERAAGWRRVINGMLRANDAQRALLGRDDDSLALPPGDPERVLAALFLPVSGTSARRRQRAVDDPGGVKPIATEAERLALLKPLADIVEARLKAVANTDLRRTQTE